MKPAMTILYEPGLGTSPFKFVDSSLGGVAQSFALKPSVSSNSTALYGIITTDTPQISITNIATLAVNSFDLSFLPQGTKSILWARTAVASTLDVACVAIATNTTDINRAIYSIYCFDFVAIPNNILMTPYYKVTAQAGVTILTTEIFFDDQDRFCFSVRGSNFFAAQCAELTFTTFMADAVTLPTKVSVSGNVSAFVTISQGGNFVTVYSKPSMSGPPYLKINAFMNGPMFSYDADIAISASIASLTAAFSPDFGRCRLPSAPLHLTLYSDIFNILWYIIYH